MSKEEFGHLHILELDCHIEYLFCAFIDLSPVLNMILSSSSKVNHIGTHVVSCSG